MRPEVVPQQLPGETDEDYKIPANVAALRYKPNPSLIRSSSTTNSNAFVCVGYFYLYTNCGIYHLALEATC
jgi:hypothetical protein